MRITHADVYRMNGEFAGWPANFGLWSWGREALCIFAAGETGETIGLHELDPGRPFVPRQARTRDGGKTWNSEAFAASVPGGSSLSADEHLRPAQRTRPRIDAANDLLELDEPIDFLDPETILLCARTGLSGDTLSWFYVSRTRGRSWDGPYLFRGLALPLAARTDIVPLGRHDALFMLTAAKRDGTEGRVVCARTRDGGRSFEALGEVGDEPSGYRIMPSSARMEDGAIFTALRCAARHDGRGWIELFASRDQGLNWSFLGNAADDTGSGGNPPALAAMPGGRLVLFYGYRDPPFGIRMRTSRDGGGTWGPVITLRDDGGTPDLGYPKVVMTEPDTLLTAYYFNDGPGEERYIASSLITDFADCD